MDWVLTGGIVMAVWAAVRLLGNERQRLMDEQTAIEATAALVPPPADAATH